MFSRPFMCIRDTSNFYFRHSNFLPGVVPVIPEKRIGYDVYFETLSDCDVVIPHAKDIKSFGFCEKADFESKSDHKPIGHYGNGFKSGSMRISNDVLVFTRHLHEQSVGMLSQTFLNLTKKETVVVPLVTWSNKDKKREENEETINNIRAITTYSHFKTEDRLLAEFKELEKLQTGTRIILYNLKSDRTGKLELDFESNPTDILNPQTLAIDTESVYRPVQEASRYQVSLREYCSILFLKPRMKIFLRGLKVKTKLICKSLSQTETDRYRPQWLVRPLKITYGFTCNKDHEDEYGIMMYHRNRLIKAYEKVGYQKQPNDLGVGVVGVVEVDFLQPIHNKQDFNKDEKYHTFMSALSQKTNEYWNMKKNGNNRTVIYERMISDWLWAQCDKCLKWRRLPDGISRTLPDKWFCYMNPDASHNRCEIEEEPEDEDQSLQYASFKKTVKLEKENEKKRSKIEESLLEDTSDSIHPPSTVSSTIIKETKKGKMVKSLLGKTSDLINPPSTVSSTIGTKRKLISLLGTSVTSTNKKLIIQDDDTNDVVAFTPEPEKVTVVDLVTDNCVEPDPKLVQKYKALRDIKPNFKELLQNVQAYLDKSNNASYPMKSSDNSISLTSVLETHHDNEISSSSNEHSFTSKEIRTPSRTSSASMKSNPPVNHNNSASEGSSILAESAKVQTVSKEVQTVSKEVQSMSKEVQTIAKEFQTLSKEVQTEMVSEDNSEKTRLLEEKLEAESRLEKFQSNIRELLSIVLPEVDLGEVEDVEDIISEIIRVNRESMEESS